MSAAEGRRAVAGEVVPVGRPFEPGHVLSIHHGAHSSRAVTPVARIVHEKLLEQAPALAAYPFLVDAFAKTYAQLLLLEQAIDKSGVLDHNDQPRESLLKWTTTQRRLAMQLLREMGLTRKVAAELQLDTALAAQAAVGAAAQAERSSPEVKAFLRERGFVDDPARAAAEGVGDDGDA